MEEEEEEEEEEEKKKKREGYLEGIRPYIIPHDL